VRNNAGMQNSGSPLRSSVVRVSRAAAFSLSVALMVGGCAAPAPPAPAVPGSGIDANGCDLSAGYQWCPRAGSCQRPSELSNRVGFAEESFAGYCRIKRQ